MNKILTTIVFAFTISTVFGQTADEIFKQAKYFFTHDDQKNGFLLLKKSAEMGHAEAQYHYGCSFRDGVGSKQNDSIANIWFLKSAKQGWAGAQHNLAYSYASGRGIKQNDNQAFYWTLKCAEQNDPECANIIIGCYTGGTGTAKNLDSAAVWVLKLASIPHDSDDDVKPATGAMITTARKTLAMLYRDGEYYPKDKIKSYMWFLIYNETRDDVSDSEQKSAIDAIKELEKKLSAEDKRKAKEMAEKQLGKRLLGIEDLHEL
jgi:TPR repeat protein